MDGDELWDEKFSPDTNQQETGKQVRVKEIKKN
jgi:hypothetical protein